MDIYSSLSYVSGFNNDHLKSYAMQLKMVEGDLGEVMGQVHEDLDYMCKDYVQSGEVALYRIMDHCDLAYNCLENAVNLIKTLDGNLNGGKK